MLQIDTSKELFAFYDEQVRLTESQRGEMRDRRQANRDRLKTRLDANDKPLPTRNIIQGSYAMRTMIQLPDNNYDIDDGAAFDREEIRGPQGGDKTPLQARQMVCEALQDGKFKRQPEVRAKCVRIFYDAGYHVDIPVYRTYIDDQGNLVQELAAASLWKASDPEAITEWFNGQITSKSPDSSNGCQMRRMICLLKKWACSRAAWNLPCGLLLTALVDEVYYSSVVRDDEMFVTVLTRIRDRLKWNKSVQNPVDPTEDFAAGREAKVENLLDVLETWLPVLDVLKENGCKKNKAMDAWRAFFSDDFFKKFKEESEDSAKAAAGFITKGTPRDPVTKEGQDTYA